jgi:hypothetical protein
MMTGEEGGMNLDALIRPHRLPWSPNPAVSDLDVWDEYEHPRTGTFSSDGDVVFFTMVAGAGARVSVWAYTCLTAVEARELAEAEFDSTESLHSFVEGLLGGRKLVFALADDLLIRNWSPADHTGPVHDLAIDFLNSILESVKDPDPATMLRAKLAQVDVATTELVDA